MNPSQEILTPAAPARPSALPRLALALLSFLALVALGVLTILRVNPPAADMKGGGAEKFLTANMLKHLERIASEPRPAGSEAHARVREYLVATLKELGLEVKTVESQTSDYPILNQLARGRVVNVVARHEGSDRASKGAVLIVAHYDSVAQAPGAGDDGAAVASILEVARALKVRGPMRNDVIFLITDAEELCLCGAKAFVESDPWAKDVAFVVNFEARGTSGPSIMFETSPGNRALVREYARAVSHPVASSLSYEVYRMMPNNTDLTVFKNAGLPGINFAFIGDAQNYHTPKDNLENLSLASAQNHGRNMLSLARWLGDRDLDEFAAARRQPAADLKNEEKKRDEDAPNATYFDVWALKVVHYPDSWNWPLAFMTLAALVAVTVYSMKKGLVTWGSLAAGAVTAILALGCVGLMIYRMKYEKSSRAFPPNAFDVGALAVRVLILLPLVAALFAALSRRWSGLGLALGTWMIWLIPLFVCVAAVPGASYLFTWPLLAALAGVAVMTRIQSTSEKAAPEADAVKRAVITALAALPAVALFAPVIYLVFLAMSVKMFAAVAALTFIVATFALPAFDLRRRA